MASSWESIIVALGIILLFYCLKRYFISNNPSILSHRGHENSSKKSAKKSQHTERKPLKHAQLNSAPHSNQGATLVLHPHSLARGGKEFAEHAQDFQGLYESTYSLGNGQSGSLSCKDILRSWEVRICATTAKHLILVWSTIVHKHCGRDYYQPRTLGSKRDHQAEHQILQEWLKQLYKWGLQRKFQEKVQLSDQKKEHTETELAENEGIESKDDNSRPCWILNGIILEKGEESIKSIGQ